MDEKPININTLFSDILPDPMMEQRNEGARLSNLISGGGNVAAYYAPQREATLRNAVGGMFGIDTRTGAEKLREAMKGVDPNNPQDLIRLASMADAVDPAKGIQLRQAAAQMIADKEAQEAQRIVNAQTNAAVLASSQDLLRANNKTELADRLPDLFADNPIKAREFAIEQIKQPALSKDQRERKIKDLTAQLIRTQGLSELDAVTKATNITDGVLRIDRLEDGSVVEINVANGTATRVPFNPTVPTTQPTGVSEEVENPYEIPEGMSLLEAVENGTGFVNMIPEYVGRVLSNIAPSALAEDKTKAMNVLRAADNGLIQAFSLNDKYPMAEQKKIRENYGIEPAMTDSPSAAKLRVLQLDEFIERELSTIQSRIDDPATPPKQINDDKRVMSNLRAFRSTLFPAEIKAVDLKTADEVRAMSSSRLNNLIKTTTEEELGLLPEEVLNAILEAM